MSLPQFVVQLRNGSYFRTGCDLRCTLRLATRFDSPEHVHAYLDAHPDAWFDARILDVREVTP